MKAVLVGATRGMGRALARRMAARGDVVFLLGRDLGELQRSAADLEARAPRGTAVGYAQCDLEHPESFSASLDRAWQATGGFDTVIVSAGMFATQARLEEDEDFTRRLLSVNFTNTVLFCEQARRRLMAGGGPATLCVFSSVAGDRGRKPVILYGSAKAGLSRYLEGLDHKFRGQGLRVVCVKPGFVRTSMTAGLPVPPFSGDPEQVAGTVLRAMDRGTPVVYVPGIWALVMLIIRLLPRGVMRRVGF